MERFAELPARDRARLFTEAGTRRGLSAAAVEKDFWVCRALEEIFSLPGVSEHLTFKGGTSLSKGWGLIERFSEDIDIVADRALFGYAGSDLSKGQLKKLRRRCQDWIANPLLPALRNRLSDRMKGTTGWSLEMAPTEEDPDRETIFFGFPRAGLPESAYLRPAVRIELGARSEPEPAARPAISSYLFEEFPSFVEASPFEVRTVVPERTLLEKAMLLHEEQFRPAGRPRPSRLSRHYYDLWCLAEKGVADKATVDRDLFERTARHRERFWAQSWVDYSTLTPKTLRIAPRDGEFAEWREDYLAMREMIFGEVPEFAEIHRAVRSLEARFAAMA